MGYYCELNLIDIKIKPESLSEVKRILKTKKSRESTPIEYFLSRAIIINGSLSFKPQKDDTTSYSPDVEYGDVPGLIGKWDDAEEIATWLKQYSEKGGRIVLYSAEGDGAAWGWEFDGKGRMRELQLCSVGKWE